MAYKEYDDNSNENQCLTSFPPSPVVVSVCVFKGLNNSNIEKNENNNWDNSCYSQPGIIEIIFDVGRIEPQISEIVGDLILFVIRIID